MVFDFSFSLSAGNLFGLFFEMDGLKRRRNSKQTNEISSDVFVTVAPELEKKTKSHSRSQRTLKIAIMGKPGVGKSG